MAYREYIGSRYVPIFGRKDETTIEWDNTKPYEPLTVVLYQGNSFTSRQAVPTGIDINDERYWAETGNYNGQIENYRREVQAFNGRINANAEAIAEIEADGWVTSERVADGAISTDKLDDDAVTGAKIADGAVGTSELADDAVTSAKIADGAVGTSELADDAVTGAKIADGAVGTSELADGSISWDKLDADMKKWNRSFDLLTETDVYIDCLDTEHGGLGDDNNTGLDSDHPFLTVDHAVEYLDKLGNNFRLHLMRPGTYTWTARVITGAVIHIFTEDIPSGRTDATDGTTTCKFVFDGHAPNGGVFLYDTHIDVQGTTANPLIIKLNGKYLEIEGSTLWCRGGDVRFDMDYLYLIDGSATMNHVTMTRGYILGRYGNLEFDDLNIYNQEAHAAFEWYCGILRCQGSSMKIGRNQNGSNYDAILMRSCTASFNANTGLISGSSSGYKRFMVNYSGVTILGAPVKTAMDGYGTQTCYIGGIWADSSNNVIRVDPDE